MITKNTNKYFESKQIKVFPCSYRGNYSYTDINGISYGPYNFDPEARLNTEYNFATSPGFIGHESYVIDYSTETNILRCAIGGYYFEISLSNSDLIELEQTIKEAHSDVSFHITTRSITLKNSGDLDKDSTRTTQVLASFSASEEDLDEKLTIEGREYYIFTGLVVGTSGLNATAKLTPFVVVDGKIQLNKTELIPTLYHGEDTDSIATSTLNTAAAAYSIATGKATFATGEAASAEGIGTYATASAAHAEGYESQATGTDAHAEGISTIASKTASHAEGNGSKATGNASHAEGANTEASNNSSHAEGCLTKAIGECSHAEGYETVASGYASHAEGEETSATGRCTHATGYQTKAEGNCAIATGENCDAIGNYSFAGGNFVVVDGEASFGYGQNIDIKGNSSVALGKNLTTVEDNQTVLGKWNKSSNVKGAFIVGNGTNDSDLTNAVLIENSDINLYGNLTLKTEDDDEALTPFKVVGTDLAEVVTDQINLKAITEEKKGKTKIQTNYATLECDTQLLVETLNSTTKDAKLIAKSNLVTLEASDSITINMVPPRSTGHTVITIDNNNLKLDSQYTEITAQVFTLNSGTTIEAGPLGLQVTNSPKINLNNKFILEDKKPTTLSTDLCLEGNLTNSSNGWEITKELLQHSGNLKLEDSKKLFEVINTDEDEVLIKMAADGKYRPLKLKQYIRSGNTEITLMDNAGNTVLNATTVKGALEASSLNVNGPASVQTELNLSTKNTTSKISDTVVEFLVKSSDNTKNGSGLYIGANNTTKYDKSIIAVDKTNTKIKLAALEITSYNSTNPTAKFSNASLKDIKEIIVGSTTSESSSIRLRSDCYINAKGYNAYSDRRLKENIKPFKSSKSILDLPVYTFDFIEGEKNQLGCIAQELQEIYPELVHCDENGILSIQESKLSYLLLEEIKKLNHRLSILEER